ncbi:MAG: beta-hydroxyacyl-ACP dehydratase [bacterium]|nr:beta-hydroxyacyl-ACP dehydratase [bacterium]
MRYLLIDRITEWEAGRSMEGVKNVSMSEDFLEYHFRNFPVMPGSLILEGLVQLAGWRAAADSDFAHWFLMEQVRSVKYYGFALPGDQVGLRVELTGEEDGRLLYKASASVEGERRVVAEFSGRRVDMADYEDPEGQRKLFRILRREATLS